MGHFSLFGADHALHVLCLCEAAESRVNALGRFRVLAIMAAMWAVYRMIPCPLTRFFRISAQMLMLSWWYPDTYELNRLLPNLDHIAAAAEQWLFGCQPSLLFSQTFPSFTVSELMNLGYTSYFPMIAVVTLFFFSSVTNSICVPRLSFWPRSSAITLFLYLCQSQDRSITILQLVLTR